MEGRPAETPDALDVPFGALLDPDARSIDLSGYPNRWESGRARPPLSYRWMPGDEDDGVTVTVPLTLLNQLDPAVFEWHVPGFRSEIVAALLRGLPKVNRRALVPAADAARSVVLDGAARGRTDARDGCTGVRCASAGCPCRRR